MLKKMISSYCNNPCIYLKLIFLNIDILNIYQITLEALVRIQKEN